MAQETWVIKGGSAGNLAAASVASQNLIDELAGIGFTGVLTTKSSGIDSYITVTPASTNHNKLEKLIRIVRAANARLVYTTGS